MITTLILTVLFGQVAVAVVFPNLRRLPPGLWVATCLYLGGPILALVVTKFTGRLTLSILVCNALVLVGGAGLAGYTGGLDSIVVPSLLAAITLLSAFGHTGLAIGFTGGTCAVLVGLYAAESAQRLPPDLTRPGAHATLLFASYLMSTLLIALGSLYSLRARLRQRDALSRIASTDPLTGTANRRSLWRLLEIEVKRATRHSLPLALIAFDLDDFKTVNDEFGHQVGDEVLVRVAGACRSAIRSTDVLSRYGGDEFLLLLPHTTLDSAILIGERLRAVVASAPVETPSGLLHFTVSVGVTSFDSRSDGDALVATVDCALYEAKRAGRNTVKARVDGPALSVTP